MAKNSEKVAIHVERRTYISPDILRLKPENKEVTMICFTSNVSILHQKSKHLEADQRSELGGGRYSH